MPGAPEIRCVIPSCRARTCSYVPSQKILGEYTRNRYVCEVCGFSWCGDAGEDAYGRPWVKEPKKGWVPK